MDAEFARCLLEVRDYRIASSFAVSPGVEVRHATEEERCKREFHAWRTCYEYMVVLDGAGELIVGDRIYRGGPGTVFLIPPQLRHENGYSKGSPFGRHLWVTVFPDFVRYALVGVSGTAWTLESSSFRGYNHFDADFIRDLKRAWDAAASPNASPEHLEELLALMRLRSTQLIRIEKTAIADNAVGAKARYQRMIDSVMTYIERQNGRDCGIDTLAKMSGYSRSRFLDLFRKYAKCTVMECVNRQRLKHLRCLSSTTPVKVVADELGFGSASAFIHWRKRNANSKPDLK